MLKNTIVYTFNSSVRLVSTTVKRTAQATVASNKNYGNKKDNYYKNLGEKDHYIDSAKPIGWDEAQPFDKIPGPKPLPILGNMWKFLPGGEYYNKDIADVHQKIKDQYGPISVLKDLKVLQDMVLLSSPEDFEILYRNEGVWPIRDIFHSITRYRQEVRKDIFEGVGGTLTVHGEKWHNFRSKVNPILMQPRVMQQYIDKMDQVAGDFVERMRVLASTNMHNQMPLDFVNELNKWAFESVAVVAVDKRLGCLDPNIKPNSESQKLINAVNILQDLTYKLDLVPTIGSVFFSGNWKKYVKIMDYITFTFLKYIDEAYANIEKNKGHESEREKSVFQRLLGIDRKIATVMALDMLMAGIDTTARTAAAALYFLAKNQNVQNKLREELNHLLPNRNSPITKDVLAEATYLKAVLKESSRVAPVVVGNARTSVKDMVLHGYQIPKGTNVATLNLVLCRSDQYFPRAKEFIPERWLRSTVGELSHKTAHPFVYLPFGFGPRSCVGKRLANLELEIVISKILKNFTLSWPHPDMRFRTTFLHSVADPLKLQVTDLRK